MKFISQLDYEHIPYKTNVLNEEVPEELKNRNVRKSGCGLCSIIMILDGLLGVTLSVEDCVKISQNCLANHATGTDMKVLAPVIAKKFGLNYFQSNDVGEAIKHLQNGGMIVAHVGVPVGEKVGLFTNGGHYIALISTDGEDFCILDPSYTPEKFTIPERVGKVNFSNAPYLYCNVKVLDSQTKPNKIKYHMFSRKK